MSKVWKLSRFSERKRRLKNSTINKNALGISYHTTVELVLPPLHLRGLRRRTDGLLLLFHRILTVCCCSLEPDETLDSLHDKSIVHPDL